jgi:hypothetical protein
LEFINQFGDRGVGICRCLGSVEVQQVVDHGRKIRYRATLPRRKSNDPSPSLRLSISFCG